MSKRVFIGVGHGGSDPGAVGNGFKESAINLTIAKELKNILVRHGVVVGISREREENDALAEEIRECNAFKPNLAVDVHTNAGGGDGFEVLCSINGGVGKTLANNINNEVKAMGQNSRGVKTRVNSNGRDYFGFIRSTSCPAVIVEGFFIDNKTDLKDFDTTAELHKLSVAYAKGILKTLGIAYKEVAATTPTPSQTSFVVRVEANALNVRSGPGTNYPVTTTVKKGQAFTIVEQKGDWGKLKSGAGWIHLGYTKRV